MLEFSQKCQEFYEQNQRAQPARRLLVYAGLYWLAAEFSAFDNERSAEYHAGLSKKFQHLVLRTLASFPLIIPSTMESIEALMAGVCLHIQPIPLTRPR